MQVRKRIKSVAAALALLFSYATVAAVPATGATAAEQTLELQNTCSVEEYEVTNWWKAELSDYDASLTPVSYEWTDTDETVTDDDIENKNVDQSERRDPPQAAELDAANPDPGSFVITTYGYGHGVGMSQNGANYYASYAGMNYQQILEHYYPGTSLINTETAGTETITVAGASGSVLDLVSQVVYNEVGSTMNPEAMKAQAVAAYTYIKYYGNNGHDLRRKANPPANVISAVESVLGEALTYNGAYALTTFYASSGGSSASCSDVFAADIPYLRSVDSEYDAACDPYYGVRQSYSAEEMRRLLENALGIQLSENPSNWISFTTGEGGYVSFVNIDGQVNIKGNRFRTMLGLRSPKMECVYGE